MDAAFDPLSTDRQLAECYASWLRWQERLREAPDFDDDPFAITRAVTGRQCFVEVGDWAPTEPLRQPLRRWIFCLAEQRINHAAITQVAFERYARRHASTEGETLVLDGMIQRALGESGRRGDWLRAVETSSTALAAAASRLWQRRREISVRMGIAPDALVTPNPELLAVAERWLETNRDLTEPFRQSSAAGLLEVAIGADIVASWPARLNTRSLATWFREGELLRDLEPRPLSDRLTAVGAASYLRGLEAFGFNWSEALAPRDQPFVIARDPYQLGSRVVGGVFAGLLLNRDFVRRHLGVERSRYPDYARSMARILLIEIAARSLKVRLRAAAMGSTAAFQEQYEQQVESIFGCQLPGTCAGVLWRLERADLQSLAAILSAAVRTDYLRDEHDQDWFRNPRAIEQLRHEAALPPAPSIDSDVLERGAGLWRRWLVETLG